MAKLGDMVYQDLVARGRKEATAQQWRALADKFGDCCGVKDAYDRTDVVKFLAQLRREGHKQSSINVMIRPIKLLAQIQKWPDGFPRLAMPKVRVSDVERPFLNHDEVCEMIRRAKVFCNEGELAYLALSTTYGLRRVELASLEVGDGMVTVDTVKGGVVTTHIIPDQIKPYIGGYHHTDTRYMSLIFQRICRKVGMDFEGKGFGWHAIRRSLATELLVQEVSALNIIRFMRWSDSLARGEFGMLVIYAKRNQAKIDRAIFEVHPFLPVWAGKGRWSK
ncbi:hypothetical protein ES708_24227 [subsurface metagenome]